MVPGRVPTHWVDLDCGRDVVVKSFRSWGRGEPGREWAALTLLADHEPGLSPEPVSADLAGEPPVIEMSRLPGLPLGGGPVSAKQAAGLVHALGRLWHAVPPAAVTEAYGPLCLCAGFAGQVRAMQATAAGLDAGQAVRRAAEAGADWLASGRAGEAERCEVVLGHGDPNLANFLWDGTQIRIVDFEDSGPSCRAFDLAILVEHRSAWAECGLDADRFLASFSLTPAELTALADYRRLAALYWLLKLSPGHQPGNPDRHDTLTSHATRLLTLLR